jgi:hypothetical protein
LAEIDRVLASGIRAKIVAAAVLRPSADDENCEYERSQFALCLALGTQRAGLWSGLGELTQLFTSILTTEDRE